MNLAHCSNLRSRFATNATLLNSCFTLVVFVLIWWLRVSHIYRTPVFIKGKKTQCAPRSEHKSILWLSEPTRDTRYSLKTMGRCGIACYQLQPRPLLPYRRQREGLLRRAFTELSEILHGKCSLPSFNK